MDETLIALMGPVRGSEDSTELRIDPATAEVELDTPQGPRRHALRSLDQLYGKGHGISSMDPRDEQAMPLLMAIESAIMRFWRENPALTDGHVLLSLRELAMNPSADTRDVLAREIQLDLRLLLSLDDYSKQEVKLGVRRIIRSVELHTSLGGRRGYLTFIKDYVA